MEESAHSIANEWKPKPGSCRTSEAQALTVLWIKEISRQISAPIWAGSEVKLTHNWGGHWHKKIMFIIK